jgi:hypothetical protein
VRARGDRCGGRDLRGGYAFTDEPDRLYATVRELRDLLSTRKDGEKPLAGSFEAGPLKQEMVISDLYGDVERAGAGVPPCAASQGCLRVPLTGENPAKWFYEWIEPGTPIEIADAWPEGHPPNTRAKRDGGARDCGARGACGDRRGRLNRPAVGRWSPSGDLFYRGDYSWAEAAWAALSRLARRDFRRLAAFLWIMFRLAALSTSELVSLKNSIAFSSLSAIAMRVFLTCVLMALRTAWLRSARRRDFRISLIADRRLATSEPPLS